MSSEFRRKRLHSDYSKGSGDDRNPFQRDRDRLLYSSAFQRLAEVTQVVSASNGYVFHNRLTHSLQVARIGRRLADKLLLRAENSEENPYPTIDPDVVESACLAHDLGHPPFGHVVEQKLNQLANESGLDGFEGNAQSFRILTKLGFHSSAYHGLDLTRATLSAVLKYPWLKGENPAKRGKWGAYKSEQEDFCFATEGGEFHKQSPEAQLMDWSDDITYTVHDLEDFYMAGRIPLHLLNRPGSEREREYFFEDMFSRHKDQGKIYSAPRREQLEKRFISLLDATFSLTEEYKGTTKHRDGLKRFTGTLIRYYINGISPNPPGSEKPWQVKEEYLDQVMMLKELIWTYVIQDPSLATQQLGQQHMVEKLFDVYCSAAQSSKEWKLFPAFFRERLEHANTLEQKRTAVDFIASLTETQVARLYARLTGLSTGASLNDPLR